MADHLAAGGGCDAKFTPAVLHRGDSKSHRVDGGEALGRGPEFQTSDYSRVCIDAPPACGRTTLDGTKLSKVCAVPTPLKQARRRIRCLIFHLELFDVGGVRVCGVGSLLA